MQGTVKKLDKLVVGKGRFKTAAIISDGVDTLDVIIVHEVNFMSILAYRL